MKDMMCITGHKCFHADRKANTNTAQVKRDLHAFKTYKVKKSMTSVL